MARRRRQRRPLEDRARHRPLPGCFYYNDLYDLTVVHSSRELLIRLLQAAGAASIIIALLYLVHAVGRDRQRHLRVVAGHLPGRHHRLAAAVQPARLRQPPRRARADRRHGTTARMVARQIRRSTTSAIASSASSTIRTAVGGASSTRRSLGAPRDIPRIVQDYDVDRIVVGLVRPPRPAADRRTAAGEAVGHPRRGCDDDLRAADRQDPDRRPQAKLADLLRRLRRLALDAIPQARLRPGAGVVGFVLAAPFTLLTALAVYLDSDGPVLYCQERVGEHGRTFTRLQVPLDARSMPRRRARRSGRRTRTTASPASAASSARPGSTSCRSSGTCSAAT